MNFDGYMCGVTGLPCCGCSMFCANQIIDTENDIVAIKEMIDQLRKCYLCTKERECIDCIYNHYKLDIILYLQRQQKKETE